MNERKQELKTNILAHWLEDQLAGTSKYFMPLLGVAAVLVAVVVTIYALRSRREAASGTGWQAFIEAGGDTAALRDVAKNHEGTDVGLWALIARGSSELQTAARQLFFDRQEAQEAAASAIEDYEKVVEATKSKTGTFLRNQALFGLGQAYELNFDVEQAKTHYAMLVSEAPATALGEMAKRRSETLSEDSIRRFYTWFNKQDTPQPGTRPPGAVPPVADAPDIPFDLRMLPDFPNLSVPSPPPAESPTLDSPANEKSDDPKADEAKGDAATGDEAKGDAATGDEAKGDPATGDEPKGDAAQGDEAKGDEAKGDAATGDEAKGDEAKGDPAKGDEAKGDEPKGDAAQGDEAKGDEAKGDEAKADETPKS